MQAQKLLGTIFLLSLMCGPTMAQTYQPAGAEAGRRFAIDHDRVFPTTNGRVGAVLIEVPPNQAPGQVVVLGARRSVRLRAGLKVHSVTLRLQRAS